MARKLQEADKTENRQEPEVRLEKDRKPERQHGEKIEVPRERESAKVINLMDALRRSAKGEDAAPPPSRRRRASHPRKSAKKSRTPAKHRKAG